MSVATKGIIKLKEPYIGRDSLLIINSIKESLMNLNCEKFKIEIFGYGVFIHFCYKNENRTLSVYFEYSDRKLFKNIQLSLGKWGNSIHLIQNILENFYYEYIYDVYFLEDDTNNDWKAFKIQKWEKMNEDEVEKLK